MGYSYEFAIATIFRNEANYLKEWIEFHREVGCSHFYLFDNLSTDHFREVLDPYLAAGIVELTSWPFEHDHFGDFILIQCLAYERALHFAKGKVKWLALIDTDEFLFSMKEDNLAKSLAKFDDFGGVGVNWQMFGTSHVPRIPDDKLLIETLHLKLPKDAPVCHKIKSIVRPERVASCESAHFVHYLPGYFQINPNCVRFEGKDSPSVQIDDLRINHYSVRDEHFLHTQKIPRSLKWWNMKSRHDWETYYQTFNAVHDESIARFIPRLSLSRFI